MTYPAAIQTRTRDSPVVYIGGLTPVKIFFRLRLQNLFPDVCPPMIAECKWLAVVL